MKTRIVTSIGTFAILVGAVTSTPIAQDSASTPSRTPWGDPDIQGLFTTDAELGVPFERPEAMGERELVTDTEFAERQAQSLRQAEADAEEFVRPAAGGRGGGGVGPPGHWLERGQPSRRTSLVIHPKNGRIPFLNEEARKRSLVAVNARTSGQRPYDGPGALDLYDRCITRGLPHVIFPTIYNNTSQIVQGPGYVAIRYEMIHDARIIPLDPSTSLGAGGSPHLPSSMRQYFGDSRGRWDGDTLVVDVTNFPTNMVNYRGATGALQVTERFRRIDANTVRYEVTVTDPATFSQPWTAALHLKHSDVPDVFEYACHEGNYAMRNILSGARAAEKSSGR